jgi:hypothetical protein
MSDKQCPNCGLWNSQVAVTCDCGFNFISTESKNKKYHNYKEELIMAMFAFPILVIVLFIFSILYSSIIYRIFGEETSGCRFQVPSYGLAYPVRIKDVESSNMVEGVPFGYNNDEWIYLKSRLTIFDTIWFFRTPPLAMLLTGGGSEGYAVVRFGVPIMCIVTLIIN